MKSRDLQPTEFESLLESASDRTLSDDESRILADYLRANPENMDAYAEHMMLNALLTTHHEENNLVAPQSPTTLEPGQSTVKKIAWPLIAAAALVILGLSINQSPKADQESPTLSITNLEEKPSEQVAPAMRSVARVLVNESSTTRSLAPGAWLWPGPVNLDSGRIHIAFDSGAEIVVTGPAKLDLQSENRCFLHEGRLTARVPPPATGFAVGTNDGVIIDVGTAFGVNRTKTDITEVHVLQGSVILSPSGNAEESLLKQGNAASMLTNGGSSKIEAISFAPAEFSESIFVLDDWPKCNVFHASFDRRPFIESLKSPDGSRSHLELLVKTGIEQGNPLSLRGFGKFDRSFRFGKKSYWLEAAYPTDHSNRARTVSFWIKVPTQATLEDAYGIVSWGTHEHPKSKWQICWNRLPQHGKIGAIRTEYNGGYAVGSTDLRDGRWHHIVSMFTGGDDANVATHIRHFVDGKLETVTGMRSGKVKWDTTNSADQMLYIGRKFERSDAQFQGELDELHIFDAALLPEQIEQLRLNNIAP